MREMPFLRKQEVFSLADIADVADFLHFSIVISNIMFIFAARKNIRYDKRRMYQTFKEVYGHT